LLLSIHAVISEVNPMQYLCFSAISCEGGNLPGRRQIRQVRNRKPAWLFVRTDRAESLLG